MQPDPTWTNEHGAIEPVKIQEIGGENERMEQIMENNKKEEDK